MLNNTQKLELVDRYFVDLFSGRKANTKRYGEEAVVNGYVVFEASNDKNLKALVWVYDVQTMPLKDVVVLFPEEEGTDPHALLERMKKHYSDIQMTSEIMVVRHLTPLETYEKHGIPEYMANEFDENYIRKIKQYE